jgi:single-stranded-DNA-specific exonuclease
MTPQDLATALNLHPLIAEILIQRGCDTVEAAHAFLDPDHYTSASPFDLADMDWAVARLRDAIARGERIRVWGDFDVDGQTATSVLLLGLRALGAMVDFTIPDRASHSHGLNKDGIRRAADDGVKVLLTCDCGVTDFAEIAFAQRLGLDVIISDHHDLAHNDDGLPKLPEAVAVINPKRLPEHHPLIHLPGVGVAYKLVEALWEGHGDTVTGRQGELVDSITLSPQHLVTVSPLLDLVALGVVADVAWQRGDTRYLLQRGLAQLRRAPRPGIRALMRAANIDPLDFDADDIGYQIGPRLNAAGRLDNAALSVELLTSDNEGRANDLAVKIEAINAERKAMQRAIELEALAMLERDPGLTRHAVIVLQSPRWHASLLGVVASAVVNRYRKPAILIAAQPGEIGRGSARSVEGVDIHAAIGAAAQSHLIEGGGGHPMAAGFGIRSENIAAFRDAISQHVEHQLKTSDSISNLQSSISYAVAWRDANLPLAEQLERLAPFGAGNPRPLLRSAHLKFVRVDPLGKDGRHQTIYLQDADGTIARAAWFNSTLAPLPSPNDDVALTFSLQRDLFNGKVRAQAVVKAIEFDGKTAAPSEPDPVALTAPFLIRDLRGEANRLAALRLLLDELGGEAVQVCSRAPKPESHAAFDGWANRARLQAKPALVVWDAPPGPAELSDVLNRASPQTVVLMCSTAGENDDMAAVMAHMQRLITLSEQRGDSLADPAIITRIAAAINQRDATVRAAIEAHRAGAAGSPRLRYLLEETRAYRRYACEAPAADVLRVG